ncbi:MAG: FliH/SctL family protein [Defluviitaleaceae bacterium]|nr:FliH/SctL family protein [Defluviitaleaceae bacterium]
MYRKIIKSHSVTVDAENQHSIGNASEEVQAAMAITPTQLEVSLIENHEEVTEHNSSNMERLQWEAEATVDNARRQAEEILAIARADAGKMADAAATKLAVERERILEEARETGYNEGHEKGYADGQKKAQSMVDEAEVFKKQTEQEREDALVRFEPEIVQLIMDVVGKIGDGAINVSSDLVLSLIRQGLGQSNFTGDVTLRVSAEDYDHVIANKSDILTQIEGGANLEIIKDHSLGVADCLIETPFGVVDSSLGMQLEEVKRDLVQILEQ